MPEKSIEERLDSHAKAIRTLRKQVADLSAQVETLLGASSPATDRAAPHPTQTPAPGVYVPKPFCLACGGTKPPNRIELTCKPCGSERNTIIRTPGATRPSYDTCGNCGSTKAPSMQLLCSPCSDGFRKYKAGTK